MPIYEKDTGAGIYGNAGLHGQAGLYSPEREEVTYTAALQPDETPILQPDGTPVLTPQ